MIEAGGGIIGSTFVEQNRKLKGRDNTWLTTNREKNLASSGAAEGQGTSKCIIQLVHE